MFLPARIAATGSCQTGTPRSTAEVAAAIGRDPAELYARTGIDRRSIALPGQDIASRAAEAVRDALDRAGLAPTDLGLLILTCSTGGDYAMPANANAVLEHLGVQDSIAAFDVNNACVGFLTALDLAARHVATGGRPVAVVASEMGSRHIDPADPRPYAVFGDAAAAAIVVPAEPTAGLGVLASTFGNRGQLRDTVTQAHGGLTGKRETIVFSKSNRDITDVALLGLGQSAQAIFARTGLSWNEVDWIVPHQPNGAMLDQITDYFGLDRAKLVPVVQWTGNVGSASMAVGLDSLYRTGQVQAGQRVLVIGVGAGLAWGAMLWQVG